MYELGLVITRLAYVPNIERPDATKVFIKIGVSEAVEPWPAGSKALTIGVKVLACGT